MTPSNAHTAAARDRLRIAIQKKGRLTAPTHQLLHSCGLSWEQSADKLFFSCENAPIDLLQVRDDDIPDLIAEGVCDLGVVGLNELEEQIKGNDKPPNIPWKVLRKLGFGRCRLDMAVPESWAIADDAAFDIQLLNGKRIATSYPAIVAAWLADNEIKAQPIPLSGSVEIAPRLGKADVVCDLVSTGNTLRHNQLKPVHTVLHSEAVLVGHKDAPENDIQVRLLQRLDELYTIKGKKLLRFYALESAIPALRQLLPDAEDLQYLQRVEDKNDNAMICLHALCHRPLSTQRLEELEKAGARRLMVFSVEQSLA